ncbi:hypothetical protein JW710_01450 [Candidatus Dojkabacteria bacterium]|nr:hypothetical protein [Candidatus Dojkabacteria bacterium]
MISKSSPAQIDLSEIMPKAGHIANVDPHVCQPLEDVPDEMLVAFDSVWLQPDRVEEYPFDGTFDSLVADLERYKYDHIPEGKVVRKLSTIVNEYSGCLRILPTGVRFYSMDRGLLILPYVADCLGFVSRSPELGITACHLALGDYSFDDILRVIYPHVKAGASLLDIVSVSGVVGVRYRTKHRQLHGEDFVRPWLPRTGHEMVRNISGFFPDFEGRVNALVREPDEQVAGKKIKATAFTIVASTDMGNPFKLVSYKLTL